LCSFILLILELRSTQTCPAYFIAFDQLSSMLLLHASAFKLSFAERADEPKNAVSAKINSQLDS
jgi:hypothetical protein